MVHRSVLLLAAALLVCLFASSAQAAVSLAELPSWAASGAVNAKLVPGLTGPRFLFSGDSVVVGWQRGKQLAVVGDVITALVGDTDDEIRGAMGASAAELAKDLVTQKIRLKRAKRAVGWGIGGMIAGPLLVVLGAVLFITILGAVAGVVLMITGGVWFAFSLPVLIVGAINKTKAKRRIDELEAKLEVISALPFDPERQWAITLRF